MSDTKQTKANAVAMFEQEQNFLGNQAVIQHNYNITVDDLAN